MADEIRFGRRSYEIATDPPEGQEFRCRDCQRTLRGGYPFVKEVRDASHAHPTHEGRPIADMVCVYCDPIAPFEPSTSPS